MKASDSQPPLFDHEPTWEPPKLRPDAPLPERMRPRTLGEFVGQSHLLGERGALRQAIESGHRGSVIFWGPPGTGKTTLAFLMASRMGAAFQSISAVTSGIADLREVIQQAKARKQPTLLFVDEIHRWNKAQQDALLPHVENGTITLIGATTENPSFEVIGPLLSRCEVYTLKALDAEEIAELLERALSDRERGLGEWGLELAEDARDCLAHTSGGDGRVALNRLERIAQAARDEGVETIDAALCEKVLAQRALLYDKSGEEHFNLISAFHKSMRGSSPDGALYWLARMLASGEDPLYVARRIVRFASEDVGLADPRALMVATAAVEAYRFLGSPEGELALAEAAVYMACAPKSNRMEKAYLEVMEEIGRSGALPVPMHLRNAPTRLMKQMGYGEEYKYAHDYEHGQVNQEHLPEELRGMGWYQPTDRGYEKTLGERLRYWEDLLRRREPGE